MNAVMLSPSTWNANQKNSAHMRLFLRSHSLKTSLTAASVQCTERRPFTENIHYSTIAYNRIAGTCANALLMTNNIPHVQRHRLGYWVQVNAIRVGCRVTRICSNGTGSPQRQCCGSLTRIHTRNTNHTQHTKQPNAVFSNFEPLQWSVFFFCNILRVTRVMLLGALPLAN